MIDLNVMARVAERKIQEAIEEGKFDNLPGKGKPLVFDDDPATPPHLRMANKVLKNAGVLPEWLQVQKDIVTERDAATRERGRIIKENMARRARVAGLPANHPQALVHIQWHAKARSVYLRRLKDVNSMILKFCVMAPSTAAPFIPYRIDSEMAEFDAEFVGPPDQPAVEIPPQAAQENYGALRVLARGQYQHSGGGSLRNWIGGGRNWGTSESRSETGGAENEDVGPADVPD